MVAVILPLAIRMVPDRHGIERFGAAFRFAEQKLRHNKPFLDEVGQHMLRSVRQNFISGGRPTKWRPLAQSTVESRVQGVESRAISKVLKRAKAAQKRLASGQTVNFLGRAAIVRTGAGRSGGDVLSARGRRNVSRRQEEIAPGRRTSNRPSHLRWTGKLYASLRAETRAGGANVGRVRVYSLSRYARIHQLGGRIQHPGVGASGSANIDLQELKRQEAAASGRKVMAFKWGGKVIFTRSRKAGKPIIIPKRPFLLFQPTDPQTITAIARRYLNRAIAQGTK